MVGCQSARVNFDGSVRLAVRDPDVTVLIDGATGRARDSSRHGGGVDAGGVEAVDVATARVDLGDPDVAVGIYAETLGLAGLGAGSC